MFQGEPVGDLGPRKLPTRRAESEVETKSGGGGDYDMYIYQWEVGREWCMMQDDKDDDDKGFPSIIFPDGCEARGYKSACRNHASHQAKRMDESQRRVTVSRATWVRRTGRSGISRITENRYTNMNKNKHKSKKQNEENRLCRTTHT
jgi:hypothetical protein